MSSIETILQLRRLDLLSFIRRTTGKHTRNTIAHPDDVYQNVAIAVLSGSSPDSNISDDAKYMWLRNRAKWTITNMVVSHKAIKRGGEFRRVYGRSSRHFELFSKLAIPSVVDDLSNQQIGKAIENAISSLKPRWANIVRMHEIDGLSFAEIAHALGDSPHAIEIVLSRAKRRLREILVRDSDITTRCNLLEQRRERRKSQSNH